ncbi:MAG: hypothetical protein A3F74_04870 [Betaproteobacteria bacterium RIFCSPLOWO2_12_FULL_62_58]|nr:MAG: hypothetical protein A3F74_04870 [Betaproteobacteria bacterium RIFCSPLOWO2_12_FULL_62_58]
MGTPAKSQTTGWLALLIGLTVVAATFGLWQALIAQERAETERAVALNLESVRNEISSGMDARILALVRMARRWEMRGQPPRAEWESDAKLYLSHYTGYLAIGRVEPDLRVSWLVPQAASRAPHGADFISGRQREALQLARLQRRVTLTHAAGLTTGDPALLVNVPAFQGEVFSGFIVGMFRAQSTLDTILPPSIAPRYAVAVFDGEEEIYRREGGAEGSAADWSQETSVGLHGITWRVRVWPHVELIRQRSPLPQAVLVGGLSLALLLALTVRFAQVARLRAREGESINRELKHVIAEHQQTNERLRKLSRAVEQSPSMVLITDRHGAIEYVNPKFTQVTGYALEEIAEKNPRLLKSGETGPEEYQHLWQTITGGEEWRGVLHDKKKNGELFWVYSAISPIRDARGAITHFLAEMEDITERKRLEQQVAERNREITKSQALAAMGQAASMIAHDLRNPLSTIKMGLQMLSKKLPHSWTEAEQELLQLSQEQERYMEEVLSDLLSYSLPDALKPEWLNVDKLLDTAVMLSQKQIEEHGVRVKTHYQPGLPVLYGDANKLRQAFINLIVNGAQATAGLNQTPSTLVIDARLCLAVEDRPSIQVEICDNGSGITTEHLDKVFEPFFTTRAQGTGLGLPIAKRIIDQHQGGISLQPGHPRGTRVTVVLPLQPVDSRSGS